LIIEIENTNNFIFFDIEVDKYNILNNLLIENPTFHFTNITNYEELQTAGFVSKG